MGFTFFAFFLSMLIWVSCVLDGIHDSSCDKEIRYGRVFTPPTSLPEGSDVVVQSKQSEARWKARSAERELKSAPLARETASNDDVTEFVQKHS